MVELAAKGRAAGWLASTADVSGLLAAGSPAGTYCFLPAATHVDCGMVHASIHPTTKPLNLSSLLATPPQVQLGPVLGSGAFGTTHRATWRGADVAVKCVRVSSATELTNFLREVEVLAGLRHPHVVPFLGAVLQVGGRVHGVCKK